MIFLPNSAVWWEWKLRAKPLVLWISCPHYTPFRGLHCSLFLEQSWELSSCWWFIHWSSRFHVVCAKINFWCDQNHSKASITKSSLPKFPPDLNFKTSVDTVDTELAASICGMHQLEDCAFSAKCRGSISKNSLCTLNLPKASEAEEICIYLSSQLIQTAVIWNKS